MFNAQKGEMSLASIQEQIGKFDNKANSLITIVGIVFALSLGILESFNEFHNIEIAGIILIKYIFLIIFSVLYFLSFATELIFLIMVIYPRKKKEKKISLSYYLDVAKLSVSQISDTLIIDENKQNDIDESLISQIKINANICSQKHKFLVTAIWLLIPLFVFMFATFFTAII